MNDFLPHPEVFGKFGSAWRYDLDKIRQSRKVRALTGAGPDVPKDASVVSWLIEAPAAHPQWHSYVLHLIHLRPVPGLNPPTIHLEDATHEILLFALNPDAPRRLNRRPEVLEPINFGAQMVMATDEAATARVASTVLEICDGQLSPDTDYLQSWIARYGSNMIKGDPARAGETKIRILEPGKDVQEIVSDPPPATPRFS